MAKFVSWRKGFDPSVVVGRFDALRAGSEDGFLIELKDREGRKVSFKGADFDAALAVLSSALSLPADLADDELSSVLRTGLLRAGHDGAFTPERVEREIARSAKERLSTPSRPYLVVGSLSLASSTRPRARVLGGSRIAFFAELPERYDRSFVMERLERWLPQGLPEDYTHLVASVTARTTYAAYDRARAQVDLLRASWSIFEPRTVSRSWGKALPPLSRIRFGPLTTIHDPNGALIEECIWIDESFRKTETAQPFRDEHRALAAERWVRKQLRRLNPPEREHMEKALRGYISALDTREVGPCFVELWSVLEYLTGGLGHSYDSNLRRVRGCFRFEDAARAKWFNEELKHLRHLRNALVHEAFTPPGGPYEERRLRVQQLRWIIEGVLRFMLGNLPAFGTLEQTFEILDLPHDHSALLKRRKTLGLALKLHPNPVD